MTQPPFTICPASPAVGFFDAYQFQKRTRPVNGKNGISWDDKASMQVFRHKLFPGRPSSPPAWTMNAAELKLVLARYLERRATLFKKPGSGTPEERITAAEKELSARREKKIERLDRLCGEYVLTRKKNPARAEVLAQTIRSLDGELCLEKRLLSSVLAVAVLHWRCGWSSSEIAGELMLTPVQVRQMCSRLAKTAQTVQRGLIRACVSCGGVKEP